MIGDAFWEDMRLDMQDSEYRALHEAAWSEVWRVDNLRELDVWLDSMTVDERRARQDAALKGLAEVNWAEPDDEIPDNVVLGDD